MYLTILNNPLHAEHLTMFSGRVFPPNIACGKRSRIRVCNHTMRTFTRLV